MPKNQTSKSTNYFISSYSHSVNPVLSPYICNQALDYEQTSFDIVDSKGVITDSNGNTLASIDLSSIHAEGVTEYYTMTKIINPHSAFLLQGNVTGDTYATQFFPICKDIQEKEGYENYINVSFDLHYMEGTTVLSTRIDTRKVRVNAESIVVILQDEFNKLNLPISVCIRQERMRDCDCQRLGCGKVIDFLVFQSTDEGYAFYIHNVDACAINADYTNYDGSYGDYSDSPFVGANLSMVYVANLIKEISPRLAGYDDPNKEYVRIPCDLFRYMLKMASVVKSDKGTYEYNIRGLEAFTEVYTEKWGVCNDETQENLKFIVNSYPEIYDYYFAHRLSVCNVYNLYDIIKLLKKMLDYVNACNVTGPYPFEEDVFKRIYPQKYSNGAMRGVVAVPVWPLNGYNGEYHALLVNHVADQVDMLEEIEGAAEKLGMPECEHVFRKVKADVKINTLIASEKEVYNCQDCLLPVTRVSSNDDMNPSFDDLWSYGVDDEHYVPEEYADNIRVKSIFDIIDAQLRREHMHDFDHSHGGNCDFDENGNKPGGGGSSFNDDDVWNWIILDDDEDQEFIGETEIPSESTDHVYGSAVEEGVLNSVDEWSDEDFVEIGEIVEGDDSEDDGNDNSTNNGVENDGFTNVSNPNSSSDVETDNDDASEDDDLEEIDGPSLAPDDDHCPIEFDPVPGYKSPSMYSKPKYMGLYGYMKYLEDNQLWIKMGEGYMAIGLVDDYQSKEKNLQNSMLVYNPNDFPVQVNFMVFS